MSIKISNLPSLNALDANTSNTIFVAVDKTLGITSKVTAHTLAQGLYSNEILNVGENAVVFPHVIGQFSGDDDSYLQVNLQNNNANGSSDFIATADNGTDASGYIDVGINGSTFNDPSYSAMKPIDGYIYVHGTSDSSNNGNLVIGTSSSGAQTAFIAGGTTSDHIVAKVSSSGFNLLQGSYKYADGTSQITAASPIAYSQAAFGLANTVNTTVNLFSSINDAQNTNLTTANTFLQSNDVVTLSSSKSYTDTANNFLQSNDSVTLSSAHSYTDTANTYIQNHYLANTTGTFAGDLTITGNTHVQAVNTGNFNVVGTANVSGTLNVVGAVSMNATLVLANSNFLPTESALTISASPTVATPSNDGYMLHISGKQNVSSRIVADSYGANTYVLFAGRSARGTVSAPLSVANGDVLMRISGNGYDGTNFSPFGDGRIDIVASENHTPTAKGTRFEIYNTPNGANTLSKIASFNGDSIQFTGVVNPEKGFILTPNVISANVTTETIDFHRDSLKKYNIINDCTFTLTNFTTGKLVEMWITNLGGANRVVTHGVSALNSTTNSTTVTIPATSSAYFKYFSIDGDLANTFVAITHA